MANQTKLTAADIASGVKLINGRKVRPGVGGALADAAESIGKTFGPKSVTQRRQRINRLLEDAGE